MIKKRSLKNAPAPAPIIKENLRRQGLITEVKNRL